jgi:Tfp pilus assembly protein PilO
MRTLKAFFLTRLLREKLLLVAFVALGALFWFSSFSKRASRVMQTHRTITSELAQQQQWLANREAIEAGAVQAVKNLDPARTLDDTRLVGDLSALARENKLRFTNDTPQTEQTGQFAIHTVQITLQHASYEDLRRFYDAITRRSPYMGIEQISLIADRPNPALLNAALRVSSVEITR